jgi:acetyltransferase-like isoleucine patch superfamily enzyme
MQPIISKNTRIRYDYSVGNYSIIDDFCYISVKLKIGDFFHIAPHVTIAGGKNCNFIGGSFGGLSSGVKIFCASDDFINDLANILPNFCSDIKNNVIKGDVVLEDAVTIGSNSVIMPNNHIPIGTCIGAMSFVPTNFKFEPWTVYAGYPKLKIIKKRNKDNILRQIDTIKYRMNMEYEI